MTIIIEDRTKSAEKRRGSCADRTTTTSPCRELIIAIMENILNDGGLRGVRRRNGYIPRDFSPLIAPVWKYIEIKGA